MLMIATTLILASVLGSLAVSAAPKPARFA
jgi:hypothetical protein